MAILRHSRIWSCTLRPSSTWASSTMTTQQAIRPASQPPGGTRVWTGSVPSVEWRVASPRDFPRYSPHTFELPRAQVLDALHPKAGALEVQLIAAHSNGFGHAQTPMDHQPIDHPQ